MLAPPAASASRLAAESNFILAPIAFAFAHSFVFTEEAERLTGKIVNPAFWFYPHAWRPIEVIFGPKKPDRSRSDDQSLLLGFSDDERRQLCADRRHWQRWLTKVGDLAREPQRIADFYRTRSYRLEPGGLAYLWPVTG